MFSIFDLLNIYSLVACAILLLWYYSKSSHSHWRKLNVKYLEPLPLVGNTGKSFFGLASLQEEYDRLYKALRDEPFGGIYQFSQPVLLIKDPELVTHILIKDFKYFPNHGYRLLVPKEKKPDLVNRSLIFSDVERWRMLRQKLSPVFSPGKLKHMLGQMLDCVDWLTECVDKQMGENDSIDLGMKDLCEKLTLSVIGSCGFGLDHRSNEKFSKMGRTALKPRIALVVRLVADSISQSLGSLLNIPVLRKDVEAFFTNLTLDTIEYRRKNGVTRNDLLQSLMELQNSHTDPKFAVGDTNLGLLPTEEFDEFDIASNLFLFFISGFDTIAFTLSNCLYELALHQNVQKKLYSEVDCLKDKDSKWTHDLLREMTYLDAIILETVRKYPPAIVLLRESVENYQIPGTNIHIPAGTNVMIPIWSIQNDWKNYPNPEVFDPERFLGDDKHSRPSGTFTPFGDGPRYCLGKRFAEMEIKVALAEIILKYELKPCAKTKIPLKFRTVGGAARTTCGTWVSFVKRKQPA